MNAPARETPSPAVPQRPPAFARLLITIALLCLAGATALAIMYGRQREEFAREQQVAKRAETILTRRSAHLLAAELVTAHEALAMLALEAGKTNVSPCSMLCQMAAEMSRQTGWTIRQVAVDPRTAVYRGDWLDVSALGVFQERPDAPNFGRFTSDPGEPRVYRYLLAQRAAPSCLRCHGASEVREAPQWAPDCEIGSVIGAISVTLPEQKLLDHR